MSLFLETIKIINGKRMYLDGHSARMNKTRKDLFKVSDTIDLKKIINVPQEFALGLVKCRVIYGRDIENIEFSDYEFRNPRTFRLVFDEEIIYNYKSTDRERLNFLFSQRKEADDILIVKNGLITDTYYANVVMKKDGRWYTPAKPLLEGTARERYIQNGKIVPADISPDELFQYGEIKIINAMTGWTLHSPVKLSRNSIFF